MRNPKTVIEVKTFISLFYLVFIEDDPKYGTRASGIFTLPSVCWPFSRIAAIVLPMAKPLPFKVWTYEVFLSIFVLIDDLRA